MHKFFYPLICVFITSFSFAQTFTRSELPTSLTNPWEIIYGPDNYLWLTEAGGKVVRIDPVSGNKLIVYTAADYFDGSNLEQSPLCFQPKIGSGTFGMALHPDFLNPATSYIYYLYSYNSGQLQSPLPNLKLSA